MTDPARNHRDLGGCLDWSMGPHQRITVNGLLIVCSPSRA